LQKEKSFKRRRVVGRMEWGSLWK